MKNILVLDEDQELLGVYKAILSRHGFNVVVLRPVYDVDALVRAHKPDLIVINYSRYGVNGGELCGKIKNNSNTKHIPIILLSDYNHVPNAKIYDCDLFLAKSISFESLIEHINNLLKISAQNF